MDINTSTRFSLSSDVRHRSIGGEGVIVRQDDGEVLVINEIGTKLVELAKDGDCVKDMIDAILLDYEVGASTLEKDVFEYLVELCNLNIIVEV